MAFGAARMIARETERIAAALDRARDVPASPWDATDGFQLSGSRTVGLPILADGAPKMAELRYGPAGLRVAVDGREAALDATAVEAADAVYVLRGGRQTVVRRAAAGLGDDGHAGGDGVVRAPMHGKVLALLVGSGDRVTRGQRLAIIEAMKMEHTVSAPHAGRVAAVAVAAGAQVGEGEVVMTIEPADE
jgi:3-methylcrotonyl-CoA carboxylase alpha subunit